MIFNYDPGEHAEALKRDGYVLLKNVFSSEFLLHLKAFLAASRSGSIAEYASGRVYGKKQQYVFDFPSESDALEFRAGLARLTGLPEGQITISERHLKQYDKSAAPFPAPHKDRGASQFSAGIPIDLGPGTSVCVFPTLNRTPNTADTAVFLTKEEYPDLDTIYENGTAKLLKEEIGDFIVFDGASLFHERVRPAGTAVLYIKFNGDGSDPLGENIYACTSKPKRHAA
jgi:hypothetical protein